LFYYVLLNEFRIGTAGPVRFLHPLPFSSRRNPFRPLKLFSLPKSLTRRRSPRCFSPPSPYVPISFLFFCMLRCADRFCAFHPLRSPLQCVVSFSRSSKTTGKHSSDGPRLTRFFFLRASFRSHSSNSLSCKPPASPLPPFPFFFCRAMPFPPFSPFSLRHFQCHSPMFLRERKFFHLCPFLRLFGCPSSFRPMSASQA